MAKPRVFLSSTYYDFKDVRVAVRAFIEAQGYEAILNEMGAISYGSSKPLDQYCYDEIDSCDIVVSLVGGRFGSGASASDGSISQNELRTALAQGKQVYIFILAPVMSEFSTYRNNKSSKIKWAHVDNEKIFEFVDEMYKLPMNNAIFSFTTAEDIIKILREQWAGLFQRLLNDRVQLGKIVLAQQLNESLTTVRQILEILPSKDVVSPGSSSSPRGTENPVFQRFKDLLKVTHRVYFKTRSEMEDFLVSLNYKRVEQTLWDNKNTQEWFHLRFFEESNPHPMLLIDESIFEASGDLRDDISLDDAKDLIRFLVYDPVEQKIIYE